MLLLTLTLAASANPGPRFEWDAEVEAIGALPAYVEELIVLASPDPARLAPDLLDTGPGMRPSLDWDGRGEVPSDERLRLMLFEEALLSVQVGAANEAQSKLRRLSHLGAGAYAVRIAQLALAVSPPDGPFDPIEHVVQWWPEPHLDEDSIEVLVDALIARAATAHLEYLRVPSEHNAVLARQEYEMVLDVLARIETDTDPPG